MLGRKSCFLGESDAILCRNEGIVVFPWGLAERSAEVPDVVALFDKSSDRNDRWLATTSLMRDLRDTEDIRD